MAKPIVLISGAGIAGPALAFWLSRGGYHVVVVEIADGIRPGGQTVGQRGAGRAVVERMALLDQMRGRSLDQRRVAWVTAGGRLPCLVHRARHGRPGRLVSDVSGAWWFERVAAPVA